MTAHARHRSTLSSNPHSARCRVLHHAPARFHCGVRAATASVVTRRSSRGGRSRSPPRRHQSRRRQSSSRCCGAVARRVRRVRRLSHPQWRHGRREPMVGGTDARQVGPRVRRCCGRGLPSRTRFPDPVPVEDCYAGLEWFAGCATIFGFDPRRVPIGGQSAGGGLSFRNGAARP
jgi:hypothetical protein